MKELNLYISDEVAFNEYNTIKNYSKDGYKTQYKWNNIVLKFQWREFYKNEIRLWNENKMYKGLPLRSWIYLNRKKYINKDAISLTHREILRCFKIAGIYHGYSFHSPFYIKQFVKDYDITSVYDPCGGWGHRLLGCSNITYIYNDINTSAYQNCIDMSNFLCMNNKYFYNNDAAKFVPNISYDAVFTCPPYYNQEIFTEYGSENYTYSQYLDWLKEVINISAKSCVKIIGIIVNNKLSNDVIKVCCSRFNLKEIIELGSSNSVSHFNRNKISTKREYLLVFAP